MSSTYTIAGVMSGTSLDGLDIALCKFEDLSGRWAFEITAAHTFRYNDEWTQRLSNAIYGSAEDMAQLHVDFGNYIGECVKGYCLLQDIKPDYISSHGHTVFHQPANKLTLQVGSGAVIAAVTGIDTICDFRSTDVALGGQGAPLVPIGDQFLFGGHRFCLNLGGFANISYESGDKRIAFDICPVNMPLNYLASLAGLPFDEGGEMAMNGNVIEKLLQDLNNLPFYSQAPPKSLGREWYEKQMLPLIDNDQYTVADRLRTVAQHIGEQIANALSLSPGTTMLTTGGGAYNNLLVEIIEQQVSRHGIHVVIPDNEIIEFKEALIFAFLGLLRVKNQSNALSSVTGAKVDSVGGAIYLGKTI
jgi:anhydro-N-acetylmuramic acid kinase